MQPSSATGQVEEIEKLTNILKGQMLQYKSLGGALRGPASSNVRRTIGEMRRILDEIEKNH